MKNAFLCIALALPALAHASLARSVAEIHKFQATAICPATGKVGVQSCKGYKIDHGIPICMGGADKAYNMRYQDTATAALKDADEKRICASMRKCAAPVPVKPVTPK